MDLSGLKWPLIIAIVVGVGWLFSSGGVEFMIKQATKHTPGVDAVQDERDEALLSRIGGYLLYLWRYQRAAEVFLTAIDRYGVNGKNYWYNLYRLHTCYERLGQYQDAYDVLQMLIQANANQYDKRVPELDNLSLRASKLKEVHELP
jgi:tetratricopeptide (TPR) repeat protein